MRSYTVVQPYDEAHHRRGNTLRAGACRYERLRLDRLALIRAVERLRCEGVVKRGRRRSTVNRVSATKTA